MTHHIMEIIFAFKFKTKKLHKYQKFVRPDSFDIF